MRLFRISYVILLCLLFLGPVAHFVPADQETKGWMPSGENLEDTIGYYISLVQHEMHKSYPEMVEDQLQWRMPTTTLTGIHFHANPFNEPTLQQRFSRWYNRLFLSPSSLARPSQRHYALVAQVAKESRGHFNLERMVGTYANASWRESAFELFERKICAQIEEIVDKFNSKVSLYHTLAKPSSKQMKELYELYLDIWVLGALLRIEGTRYASAHYFGVLSERLRTQSLPLAEQIDECRVALVRMSSRHYLWP